MISVVTMQALLATMLALAFPFWSWSSMLAAVEQQEEIVRERERFAAIRREESRLALQAQLGLVAMEIPAPAAPEPTPRTPAPARPAPPTMIGIAVGGF